MSLKCTVTLINYVVQGSAIGFENGCYIRDGLLRLLLDAIAHEFSSIRVDRTSPSHEDKIAGPHRSSRKRVIPLAQNFRLLLVHRVYLLGRRVSEPSRADKLPALTI